MVEKGSTLLEIKGAAFFVWDRKRWYWNKKTGYMPLCPVFDF